MEYIAFETDQEQRQQSPCIRTRIDTTHLCTPSVVSRSRPHTTRLLNIRVDGRIILNGRTRAPGRYTLLRNCVRVAGREADRMALPGCLSMRLWFLLGERGYGVSSEFYNRCLYIIIVSLLWIAFEVLESLHMHPQISSSRCFFASLSTPLVSYQLSRVSEYLTISSFSLYLCVLLLSPTL